MRTQGANMNGEMYSEHILKPDDDYAFYCDDDGMTRQEFKDECDINVLMAQYEKHGTFPPILSGTPQYLDVSEVPDLMQAISIMDAAERAFMTLPAKVRKEFDNSAVNFVEYAQDPANRDQMAEWGLAAPRPVPEPVIPTPVSAEGDAPKAP